MNRLLEKIQDDIKKKEIQQNWLAKKIGCSKESLTYYLQGKNHMKFYQFLLLINNVYDDKEILREYLMEFVNKTSKKDNIKESLEWSIQNAEHELFDLSISKTDEETSAVYKLIMLRNQRKISDVDLFESVESMKLKKIKQIDVDVLLYIVSLYAYYDMKKYDFITLYTNWTLKRVESLKDGFIKEAFRIRIQELAAVSYLKEDNPQKAEAIANYIINNANIHLYPNIIISMFNLLSEIYVFSDPKKSIEYNSRAIKIFEEMKFSNYHYRELSLKATHDFIKITNGIYEGLYLLDQSERAHFFAKQKDEKSKRKALQILKKIEQGKPLSPHQLYYKYLATGKEIDLEKAKKEFYKRGDFYYCKLVEGVTR